MNIVEINDKINEKYELLTSKVRIILETVPLILIVFGSSLLGFTIGFIYFASRIMYIFSRQS